MKYPTRYKVMFLMVFLVLAIQTVAIILLFEPTMPLGPNNTVGPIIRVQPVAKLTTINWPAFNGTKPVTIQALLHSPPGTRVELILTENPEVLQHWGFTTDHRGAVFDKSGDLLPDSAVNASFTATATAAHLSDTVVQINNEFIAIQQGLAYRASDATFHDWSNEMLSNGHFVFNGYEYKVDDQYVYAIGPDDHVYRSIDAGHFNKRFKLIRLQ